MAWNAVATITDGSRVSGGWAAFGDLKVLLERKIDLGEQYFPATYAGWACLAVATDMLAYRHKYSAMASSGQRAGPEDWDASFWACIALAGTATWEEDRSGDSARRHFWTWYLERAIPDVFSPIDPADRNQLELF